MIADIAVDAGAEVAEEIGAAFERLDVSDPDAWDRIVSTNDPFDIGVLNAGIVTRQLHLVEASEIPLADLTDVELGLTIVPPSRIAEVVVHALEQRSHGPQWVAWGEDPIRSYEWNPAL